MATFDNRPFMKAVDSLGGQCDEIIVYDNNKAYDLTDNGKFWGLTIQDEPCYYLTCDDDLLYPENYVKNLTDAIDRLGTIVTHHGRKLKGKDLSYYRGHESFRCLDAVYFEGNIDVAGTGVTGFRTDYFNPVGLHLAEDKRMSDLVFSLEAAKQGKEITVLRHGAGWIKHLPIDLSRTIHAQDSRNEKRHIEIANEIYNLKHGI